MRDSRNPERTDGESTGLLGRVRGQGRVSEEPADPTGDESGPESWFNRKRSQYGIGALLVGIGIVLFFFPEPMTSTVGIAAIVFGALIWLVNAIR